MNRRAMVKQMGAGLATLSTNLSVASTPGKRVLRIAHVTDTHVRPLIGAAKGFEKCLHNIQALADKPDLLINGGDAIMNARGQAQQHSVRHQWKLYRNILSCENGLPILNCIGNHDIWRRAETSSAFYDGRQWAMDELEMTRRYYSITRNGWHIIVLDSVQPKADGSWYTAYLDEEQFIWLENDLKKTAADIPVLLISHVPILAACVFFDGKRFDNNTWTIPANFMHSDTVRLTNLFSKYPNVKAAISGHIHLVDRVDYKGVSYFCNGAVSGAWWFGEYHDTPPGYALVDLYDDGSVINTYCSYQ
jgi:3',5'-cyclic AMP phosphodiesterase CpdA